MLSRAGSAFPGEAGPVTRVRGGCGHCVGLGLDWPTDNSLADSDNRPPPEVIAQDLVEDPEAALEQFRLIATDLNGGDVKPGAREPQH